VHGRKRPFTQRGSGSAEPVITGLYFTAARVVLPCVHVISALSWAFEIFEPLSWQSVYPLAILQLRM